MVVVDGNAENTVYPTRRQLVRTDEVAGQMGVGASSTECRRHTEQDHPALAEDVGRADNLNAVVCDHPQLHVRYTVTYRYGHLGSFAVVIWAPLPFTCSINQP
jgi:hypothetical protein